MARIASVDQADASAYEVGDSQAASESSQHGTCKTSSCAGFNGSGLPQTLKATWSNADTILKKGGVTKISGADSTFAVKSLTNAARPHIVNKDSGRIPCDCDGFKRQTICSHGLAVACTEDILQDTVSKWVPNYSSLMQDSIPQRSGQKPDSLGYLCPVDYYWLFSIPTFSKDLCFVAFKCSRFQLSTLVPFYQEFMISIVLVQLCFGCANSGEPTTIHFFNGDACRNFLNWEFTEERTSTLHLVFCYPL